VTFKEGVVPTLVILGILRDSYDNEGVVLFFIFNMPFRTVASEALPACQFVISSASMSVPNDGTVPAFQVIAD